MRGDPEATDQAFGAVGSAIVDRVNETQANDRVLGMRMPVEDVDVDET
jgi:hypothetical protein